MRTSRYLTKITTLRRKADREQLRVLAAKHTASLQLLCTVGGTQARLDARTEFKISQRSPKGGWSWSCKWVYTQGPFWLPWRIILVGRENQIQNLLDDAPPTYISSTYASSFAYASAKTQIRRCLCNCRWNLAMSYGWKLTILTKIKHCRSKVLAAKHAASLQLLCILVCIRRSLTKVLAPS
jgi:hypothetical protein